ncbi:unnamed protein product [Caenorhabditis angaria]|uniref:Uncharacterized protein n=1 Tax=Caenorhabditis angaria TaxID=860376 RepID=A0A9P1NBF2_9PELO|nr:unnamed protein product [Caenorhabditis angaria]
MAEDFGNCKICLQKSDGIHFSVISCRACAAFFRRTVIMNLQYTCSDRDRCQVEKDYRNMCRSCRYQRCLREGMKTESVQIKRDSIGRKKPFATPATTSSMSLPSGLSENFKKLESGEKKSILSQMSDGYDHFLKIRKATNSLMQKNMLSLLKDEQTELQSAHFDSAKQVCQVEAHLVTDIVNTYFHPFSKLKFEDKVALFKNFFCYFSHTDRAYQSYLRFEQDSENDKIVMPDGGFIKKDELEKFYENSQGVHTSAEDAAKIFQPVFDYILEVIVGNMRKLRIREFEYLALLGFCLWDDAVPGLSEEAKNIASDTQIIILNELQCYYTSKNLTKISTRVGQLLLLVPKLTKCVIMVRENSVLAELFNYYEADVCCKNFKNDTSVKLECTSTCIVHTRTQTS